MDLIPLSLSFLIWRMGTAVTFLPPHTMHLSGELNNENMLTKASGQTSAINEKVLIFIKVKLIQEQGGKARWGFQRSHKELGCLFRFEDGHV